MEYEKIEVEVVVRFLKNGGMRPLFLVWENGTRYEIDSVIYFERACVHVSSVLPVRFICVMGGREKYLYFEREEERWFVEKVSP